MNREGISNQYNQHNTCKIIYITNCNIQSNSREIWMKLLHFQRRLISAANNHLEINRAEKSQRWNQNNPNHVLENGQDLSKTLSRRVIKLGWFFIVTKIKSDVSFFRGRQMALRATNSKSEGASREMAREQHRLF